MLQTICYEGCLPTIHNHPWTRNAMDIMDWDTLCSPYTISSTYTISINGKILCWPDSRDKPLPPLWNFLHNALSSGTQKQLNNSAVCRGYECHEVLHGTCCVCVGVFVNVCVYVCIQILQVYWCLSPYKVSFAQLPWFISHYQQLKAAVMLFYIQHKCYLNMLPILQK
jgi:hypothetical protein